MKKHILAILSAVLCGTILAAVPVRWTAETSRVQPIALDAWRGDTLALECTLKSYGQPVALGAATASIMWQTNGMGNVWWQTNATVSADGVIRATWSPSMDPGAPVVAFFLPVQTGDGANYRAAGTLRFRPSPGAESQIAALPQPGGTLDFGAFQLVNAPWATLEAANEAISAAVTSATGALVIPPPVDLSPYATTDYVSGSIASATGALVIPPPVDLSPYATTGAVEMAVQTARNALAGDINAVSNAAMPRADMGGYATTQDVAVAIAGIRLPSLDGYATEQYVASAIEAIDLPSLSGYATTAYADLAASNAQAAAVAAIPSLSGYATEQYVASAIESIELPSLSGYATTAYADAAASNAQAAAVAAIPSLSGYATQQYVADYLATNNPPVDLSPYATTAYVDAAASNVQASAIAAIPNLSGLATETYAQSAAADAAAGARSAAEAYARSLSWGSAAGNTRLVTLDGSTWQDATGTVWQVSDVYGWAGTVIDLSTSAARPITFAYAGKTAAAPDNISLPTDYWTAGDGTNLYYDGQMTMSWILWMTNDYHGTTGDYWPASGTPAPSLTATNLSFNTAFEQYTLFWCPVSLATNPVDRVLYASGGVSAELGEFARTNDVLNAGPYLALTGGVIRAAGGPRIRLEGTGASLGGMPAYMELAPMGIDVVGVFGFDWLHIEGNGFRMNNLSGDGGLFSFPYEAYETGGTIALRSDLPDTASITNDIADLRTESALVYRLYSGSNVVAEVTNYNSQVHAPSLRLLQLNESNEYITVWTETNGLARTLAAATNYADEAISERAAPRAWSGTTSGLGFDAPDGMTWVSTSNLVIAGGLEYEKHVTTGGAIWLLESNGMTADFHALSNNTAYLDISAADGTSIFRIEKSDSFLVGVHVNNVSVDGSTLVCGVHVVAAEHPLVRVKAQLTDASWSKEEDGTTSGGVTTIPGLATITWSGSSGNWTCRIANLTGGGSLFAQMEYLQEGGTKIVNTAPLDVTPGILCTDGVHKVRPVYNNGTITWEVVP